MEAIAMINSVIEMYAEADIEEREKECGKFLNLALHIFLDYRGKLNYEDAINIFQKLASSSWAVN